MNDDGVHARGIDVLVEALRKEPGLTIKVVAPAKNQSGVGGKTTAGTVSYSTDKTISGYPAIAVDGTPADAAGVAFDQLHITPDFAISGANAGQNLGPLVDISGTVGAARVAARRGVPALAVSSGFVKFDYGSAARYAVDWLRERRSSPPSGKTPALIQSLNVPSCQAGSVRGEVTVPVQQALQANETALGPQDCSSTATPKTEVAAFSEGFATLATLSVTPG